MTAKSTPEIVAEKLLLAIDDATEAMECLEAILLGLATRMDAMREEVSE